MLLSKENESYQRNNEFDKMKNNLENIKIRHCFKKNNKFMYGGLFNQRLNILTIQIPITTFRNECEFVFTLQQIFNMHMCKFDKYTKNNQYVNFIKELWMTRYNYDNM